MRVHRPLLLLLAALTAGCADPEPFVDQGPISLTPQVVKPVDPVLKSGIVRVCYSDATPWREVEALAQERCAAHGLNVYQIAAQRYQCRVSSPHLAQFMCFDPEMMRTNGMPVNPFDPEQVSAWEKATGKKAKPHNAMTGPNGAKRDGTANAAPAPGASPTPAPTDTVVQPPAPATAPVPATPPAAPQGNGFTLPQGSWGDHFQE